MATKKESYNLRISKSSKDLLILAVIFVVLLIASFYFNVFRFLVEWFQKNPYSITFFDEIIVGLLTLSIGFAVIAWRRLRDLKEESEKCILAEREVARMADTKAEAERIVSKQLHAEIEILLKYLKEEREIFLSRMPKR